MKKIYRLLIGLMIVGALVISACAPPPPPVSKMELANAKDDALAEEKKAETLEKELKDLEEDVAVKEAELKSLQKYQQKLQTGK